MAYGNAALADLRGSTRNEVHYRTRAYGPGSRPVSLLIVNLSAQGLMARYDGDLPIGTQLRITLPLIGTVTAEVRWSLGGRIGCEFDQSIAAADYLPLLATLAP